MRKFEHYAFTCYRHAPESFKAYKIVGFSHGDKNIPEYDPINLSYEEISILGNICICKGRSEALAKLKSIVRERERKTSIQYVTYGFLTKGNKRRYYFVRNNIAKENDISDKLRVYKIVKNEMLMRECKIEAFQEVKLQGDYSIDKDSVKIKYDIIDIEKPCRIKVKFTA